MTAGARPRGAIGALVSIAVALSLLVPHGPSASATAPSSTKPTVRVHAATVPAYTAALTYRETSHGRMQGATTIGIHGNGLFSAQLSPLTRAQVSVLALATGVPLVRIAAGGTYVVQRQVAGDGTITGMAVARFNASALGSVCISYTETPGVFVPGMPFVPMSGSMTVLGGTRSAAAWHLRVDFAQTALTGWYIERVQAGGWARVATGALRPMTRACRRVAAITR